MASTLDLASLAIKIRAASDSFPSNEPLNTAIVEWCISSEISSDTQAALKILDSLVEAGYLVTQETSNPSSGKVRSKKHKENSSGSDEPPTKDSESSNASSVGSSVSMTTHVTYIWNESALPKPVEETSTSVDTVEGETIIPTKKRGSKKKKADKVDVDLEEVATSSSTADHEAKASKTSESTQKNGNDNTVSTTTEGSATETATSTVTPASTATPNHDENSFMFNATRSHRAPSVMGDAMATLRAKNMVPVPEADEDSDSLEEAKLDRLDDTTELLQKYILSLAPELRKKFNSADYSILMSSIVKMCQERLHWTNDNTVLDEGKLRTKSLAQLNKSIDTNYSLLVDQLNRMVNEKDIEVKREVVRTLREMKKLLEAPLLQERIELNPGEEIEWKAEGVMNLDTNGEEVEEGRLVFTNYRCMYFGPSAVTTDTQGTIPDISIPLGMISQINKLGDKKISSKTKRLELVTKDLRTIRWGFKSGSHRRKEIFQWFKSYIANMPQSLFCWQVKPALDTISKSDDSISSNSSSKHRNQNAADPMRPEFDGWSFYDPHTEFLRQGVSQDPNWTYTNANANYELCDTYPNALWVPSACSTESLTTAASFRSRNRLPVLAYYYEPTKATISRCSQPATGVGRKRSKEDEQLLIEIGKANQQNQKVPIYDARPKANAVANTAMGYGYELIQNYPNCSLTFCDIANIHVMRSSLAQLRAASLSGDLSKWLTEVEASGWLHHQIQLIVSSLKLVDHLHNQSTSVVVHCSDGWDRTAQMVSLACLMLDPFYRTLNGFATLIEKDWLSFGHRFALRHAFDGSNSGDRAPIFHQFIETVWQFWRQHPIAFEFNETFLITLVDEVYNAYYGTFLYDSQKERVENQIASKTISVWTALLGSSTRNKFINPLFTPHDGVLLISSAPQAIQIWEQYYFRYNDKIPLPLSYDQLVATALQMAVNHTSNSVLSNQASSSNSVNSHNSSSSSNGKSSSPNSTSEKRKGLTNSSPALPTTNHKQRPTSVEPQKKKHQPYKRSRNTDPDG